MTVEEIQDDSVGGVTPVDVQMEDDKTGMFVKVSIFHSSKEGSHNIQILLAILYLVSGCEGICTADAEVSTYKNDGRGMLCKSS